MKKFTKVALVIAALVGGIGICSLVGAVAKGLTWKEFANMVTDGRFSFDSEELAELGIGNSHNGMKDTQTQGGVTEIDEAFSSLDVEVGTVKLEIYYADVDKVRVEYGEMSGLKCYVKEATLHIEANKKHGANSEQEKIVIYIPRNDTFAEFELDLDAGEAIVEGIIANEVNIDVGAGKATVTNLDAKEVDASADVGELYLEVVGKQEDYSYTLECGMGTIQIGNMAYAGLGGEKTIRNTGATRSLEADCGLGKVQITFVQ